MLAAAEEEARGYQRKRRPVARPGAAEEPRAEEAAAGPGRRMHEAEARPAAEAEEAELGRSREGLQRRAAVRRVARP